MMENKNKRNSSRSSRIADLPSTFDVNITNISSQTDVTFSCPPRPPPISFEGQEIRGSGFGPDDYTGANFRGATLIATSFTGTNLTGADFTGARIISCIFRDVNFTDADFSGLLGDFTSQFIRSNLSGANLSGKLIRGTIDDDVIMNNAICIGTFFDLQLNNRDQRGIIFTKEDLAQKFCQQEEKIKRLRKWISNLL